MMFSHLPLFPSLAPTDPKRLLPLSKHRAAGKLYLIQRIGSNVLEERAYIFDKDNLKPNQNISKATSRQLSSQTCHIVSGHLPLKFAGQVCRHVQHAAHVFFATIVQTCFSDRQHYTHLHHQCQILCYVVKNESLFESHCFRKKVRIYSCMCGNFYLTQHRRFIQSDRFPLPSIFFFVM